MPDPVTRAAELRAAGWTQRAIAVELGISTTRVQQLLKQARTPEQVEELRARVSARASELRAAGIRPWT